MHREFAELKRYFFDLKYRFLNKEQREAVYTVKDPLLILAGAGSGKTTVLVNRIAYLIKYGDSYFDDDIKDINENELATLRGFKEIAEKAAGNGSDEIIDNILDNFIADPVYPDRILAITFTNKAANEIKERLQKLLGEKAGNIWAGTFHSVCVRILRRHINKIGYDNNFTIYDMDDVKKQITEIIKELNIDEKILPARSVMNAISRYKEKLLYPSDLTQTSNIREKEINDIYEKYQRKLEKSNALDFDDIIALTVKILAASDEAFNYYADKFEYVLIDEYQDTNHAQYYLAKLLSSKHRNIMVVGDDDQSIYKFRGATIENILNFQSNFKNAKIIKLEQNYRSTQNILNAANSVIDCNSERMGKNLWTRNTEGDKLILKETSNQNDEAQFIVSEINRLYSEGKKFKDCAVLYRVNAQSNGLETAFVKSGAPYRVLGGIRFFERKEIKDMIAYLCVVNNPNDVIRLRRIINEPKRGIGETTLTAVEQIAFAGNTGVFDVIQNADKHAALSRASAKLKKFAEFIIKMHELMQKLELPEFIEQVFEESGYRNMLELGGTEEQDRLENVKELISSAILYVQENEEPTITGFLEEKALISDIDNYDAGADAVTLMTIHSAKGLEFPVVFIPGFEENLFPSRQSADDPDQLEEERRLAYVAITRAKEKLYLTYAKERLIYGKTMPNGLSRFVTEIAEEYIDKYELPPERNYQMGLAVKKQSNRVPENSEFSTDYKTATSAKKYVDIVFKKGDLVSHITFGRGMVISVRDMGGDILYEVNFEAAGTKKMMATYAKLKPAE